MDTFIKNITLGIRFEQSFRLKDSWGSVIDMVIKGQNTPFKFLKVFESDSEIMLSDSENNDDDSSYLKFNIDGVIFNLKPKSKEDSLEKNMKLISQAVAFLASEFFKKFAIGNIGRIGIVFNHNIEGSQSLLDGIVQKITNNDINFVENFSLRFTKKTEDKKFHITKGINNSINKIFTFHKVDNKNLIAALDYQQYFSPHVTAIDKINYAAFLSESQDYLTKSYYSYLKNLPTA